MKTTQNLELLKQHLKQSDIDFFILPNSDEFGSEYLPEHCKRLQFISGFTGSNAFVIIGQKKSAFFTDGRYSLQAAMEVNEKDFAIYNLSEKSPLNWLLENDGDQNSSTGKMLINKARIGFDGKLHNVNFIQNYQKYFGENLICLEQNPIDIIWENRPKPEKTKVFKHEIKYSGLDSDKKIKQIIGNLEENIDAIILTNPASICWLLNIRAADVAFSPLLLTYALIDKNGQASLFKNEEELLEILKTQSKKLSNTDSNHALASLAQENQGFSRYHSLSGDEKWCNLQIQTDLSQANYWLYDLLLKQKTNIVSRQDPCLIYKAIKNQTEIDNAVLAHKIDGLAVTKFLFWLEKSLEKTNKDQNQIDEISAAKKLLEFRKASKEFLYPSFETIAGFAANGAIVHYHSHPQTNKVIESTQNSLFLIDSGGQYLQGTTDITRTVAVGTPSFEMIENFTRVLKGHISIARAKFPAGTTGNKFDILARYHLWQQGLDYDHGTGHGVGSFSSVHEAPPSISKRDDNVPLQSGMILSNEPGFYKTGEYGIRIENLILVEEFGAQENKEFNNGKSANAPDDARDKKQFLQFKTITLAPIDSRLIDFKMLTYPEKKWLRNYHCKVFDLLKDGLSEEEKTWLENIVQLYNLA